MSCMSQIYICESIYLSVQYLTGIGPFWEYNLNLISTIKLNLTFIETLKLTIKLKLKPRQYNYR